MSKLTNKEIQTNRMMALLIDSTAQIIEEEGINNVTIRKVADVAGYNSATIYNYFEEFSHLIFFSSMKFIKKYTDSLPKYVSAYNDPINRYLFIWDCFCKYSFKDAEIYYAVFSADLGCQPKQLQKKYYGIFPTNLKGVPQDLHEMLLESNLLKRIRLSLDKCIEEKYIEKEQAETIARIHHLIWQGMLTRFINKRSSYTASKASDVTLKHIRDTVTWFR